VRTANGYTPAMRTPVYGRAPCSRSFCHRLSLLSCSSMSIAGAEVFLIPHRILGNCLMAVGHRTCGSYGRISLEYLSAVLCQGPLLYGFRGRAKLA